MACGWITGKVGSDPGIETDCVHRERWPKYHYRGHYYCLSPIVCGGVRGHCADWDCGGAQLNSARREVLPTFITVIGLGFMAL